MYHVLKMFRWTKTKTKNDKDLVYFLIIWYHYNKVQLVNIF